MIFDNFYNFTISIHAPRVGGDLERFLTILYRYDISIHAPRVGGDPKIPRAYLIYSGFQSTPPVWGATFRCLS